MNTRSIVKTAHSSAGRGNFELIKAKYNRIGKNAVRLTQSSLFFVKDIDLTKSSYSFDVLENQTQNLRPDEIRLNINDEFIITHMGVYLYADFGKKESPIIFPNLLSYPPLEMSGDCVGLKPLYAGQLKISVNNIVYLEKWDTRKHEYLPRTQFASLNAAGVTSTVPSNDFAHDSMVHCEPMLTLSGAKKNEIVISLPQAIAAIPSFAYTNNSGEIINVTVNKIALRLFGLNAQNGAKFQS